MPWLLSHPWWDDEHYWFEKEVFHKGTQLYVQSPVSSTQTLVTKPLVEDGWLGWDDVIGGTLVVWGSAMLVPGPIDALAAAAGAIVFKGPHGGVIGWLAYNVFASLVLLSGLYLISLD